MARGAPPPSGDWLAAGGRLAAGESLAVGGVLFVGAGRPDAGGVVPAAAVGPALLEQAARAATRPVPPAAATTVRRVGSPVELELSATV
ncbi:hypothetical protein [Kitasatospora sp. MMS16-BH015]|uniref:hypothetical protein n=1 Tax=Kitasatospora sp. MMS16-BH015 TaxID=2018025 RepID=UPI00352D621D